MKPIIKFLIAAIMAAVPVLSLPETVSIILKNGTTLVGELVSIDPTSVVEINLAGIKKETNYLWHRERHFGPLPSRFSCQMMD